MNPQDKAKRKAIIAAGGNWRKTMATAHKMLVFAVLRNKEKQERSKH